MLLGPSDCPRLRFNVLSIDYVRITNCFYDYDYDYEYNNSFRWSAADYILLRIAKTDRSCGRVLRIASAIFLVVFVIKINPVVTALVHANLMSLCCE